MIRTIYLAILGFLAYFSTYFLSTAIYAGKYEEDTIFGNFKNAIAISQILGSGVGKIIAYFMLPKLQKKSRLKFGLITTLLSYILLVLFSICPDDVSIIMLFLSTIPSVFAWGCVVFYMEGRDHMDIIYMLLYFSVIIGGGISRTVGDIFIQKGISEKYMPSVCGIIGLVGFNSFLYLLSRIPEPTEEEKKRRQKRDPCTLEEQNKFFRDYRLGLVLTGLVFGVLSAYRNYRDYYSLEIWNELLGEDFDAKIYSNTESIIGVSVILAYGFLIVIKKEIVSFFVLLGMMIFGGFLIGLVTILYYFDYLSSFNWIVIGGIGLFLSFVPPRGMLYDKMMSVTKTNFTTVFLVYFAETIAQIVTLIVILLKSWAFSDIKFSYYFELLSYVTAGVTVVGMSIVWIKFYKKIVGKNDYNLVEHNHMEIKRIDIR